MWLRNRLFDVGWKQSHRASVPVVSVGNLTLGGTGKTPFVEFLADFYGNRGQRVGILSRGYGAQDGKNDEAMLLEDNLPAVRHLQGRDRVALAATAVREKQLDLLILDDGFQHRRLARDLDVVLIDTKQCWGLDFLFPRGLMRESWRELRRANVVILTRCDQVSEQTRGRLREAIARVAPSAVVAEGIHRPERLLSIDGRGGSLDLLNERPVAAFCGIGNPDAFAETLVARGCELIAFRRYPDHHVYSRDDVNCLHEWASGLDRPVRLVTTQKDLVKLRSLWTSTAELWALRVRFQFRAGYDELERKLVEVIDNPRQAEASPCFESGRTPATTRG